MRWIWAMALMTLLSGCAEGFVSFPVTEAQQDNVSKSVDIVRIEATNIAQFSAPFRGHVASTIPPIREQQYAIGPGDVLSIIVFDHPELTIPGGAENGVPGFRVGADGTFNYPFIGRVRAAGRSTSAIRTEIARRLAFFIPDPQVDLSVSAYNARSVLVTGAVASPSRQPLTEVSITLLDAITASGGLSPDADPGAITIRRHGKSYSVDLQGFFDAGIERNNPVLHDEDVINVPQRVLSEAYILGEVGSPGVVDLTDGAVSLTQALARQGGLDELRADARGIFVFRIVNGRQTVYQLDISTPVRLTLGTRFNLFPNDVIYVVRSPLTRWNDTISRILPSVTAYQGAQAVVQ